MANGKDVTRTRIGVSEGAGDVTSRKQAEEVLLKAGALQKAIFNSANFSSIATDAKGVIQIFNVGAERMLGYTAADVRNKITPADISDPQELIARAKALSIEIGTPITPGFEALRSEEHTSELQSRENLVCRLLLENKHNDLVEVDVGSAGSVGPRRPDRGAAGVHGPVNRDVHLPVGGGAVGES